MLIYGFLPIALYILKIIVVRKSQYKIFSFHINCKMGWEKLQLKSESSMCAIYIFCIACFSLQFLGAVYQYWLYHQIFLTTSQSSYLFIILLVYRIYIFLTFWSIKPTKNTNNSSPLLLVKSSSVFYWFKNEPIPYKGA